MAKKLAERVAAIAATTPRESIELLLKRLMPRKPVSTRPPLALDSNQTVNEYLPSPMEVPYKRDPLAPRRRVVVRSPRYRRYEPTGMPDVSRYGSFRRYMLTEIILAHRDTFAADQAHRNSGRFAEQTINFSWAAKEGYIRFI